MYETRDEAQNRLLNTVVSYDGFPHRVINVGGRVGAITLAIVPWPFDGSTGLREVRVSDPLFKNFRTPPLGFVNYFEQRDQTHVSWVERVPARRMHQGLNDGNTHITSLGIRAIRTPMTQVQSSEAFKEMIVGEYPTFEEVVDLLVPESSIAFDREYALFMSNEGYVTIYHKRDPLGLVMNGVIHLRADRFYAREALVEHERIPNDIQNL